MLKQLRKGTHLGLVLHLAIATLTGLCLFLVKAEIGGSGALKLSGLEPASAQTIRPQDVWRQVYERLPELPMENQYVSKETGKVDAEDTLASRLMQYHIYVKRRPPFYRFDWKLTLADYLGANELMVETQYPSSNDLQNNPMASDRAAIQKLSRAQRDALVNVLVSIYTRGRTEAPTPTASPPPPTNLNPRATPVIPKPGDAQLLLP